MRTFFSPSPVWSNKGLFIVRMIVGLLLVYHGFEVFNPELMRGYAEWELFRGPSAAFKVYAGKGAELVAGIMLCLGCSPG